MSLSSIKVATPIALTLALAAAPLGSAQAAVADAVGDFLATYTGPHNADLDVTSVNAVFDATNVYLTGTVNGPIGTTPTGLYVWGVDRGAGTAGFVSGTPSTGAGVLFDSVIILSNTGTGMVNLLNGSPATALAAGAVTISNRTITAVVPLSLLPSTGFTVPNYGYNLWPRSGAGNNAVISDFAPDASTFKAVAVPEPASWALLIAGFAGIGLALRRQRRTAPA